MFNLMDHCRSPSKLHGYLFLFRYIAGAESSIATMQL